MVACDSQDAMSCATCGAATKIVDASGNTKQGQFYEKYECARGHIGRIKGKNEANPKDWTRTGAVFNDD